MLSKLFESLYHKIFVNIVVGRSHTVVYIQECNSKEVLSSDSESFNTITMNPKMYEYIHSATSQSPFHYISVLDTSNAQGAIPTCTTKDMSKFCDLDSSKYICYKNKWAYFTSKSDLNALEKSYKQTGLDFVFSPFVILANFFKDKINTNLAIYVLLEDNYITIGVFEDSELLYSDHINMEHGNEHEEMLMDESDLDDMDLDLDSGIDLEDIDAIDDIEGLDDFGDIEDLDMIDEIDEFSEDEEEEEELEEEAHTPSEEDIDGFNEDYQRFSLIQSSINNFYKDAKYDSKFMENIYIADTIGVSGDLKRYLEDEMFLSVFVRHLDLCSELAETAKAELK